MAKRSYWFAALASLIIILLIAYGLYYRSHNIASAKPHYNIILIINDQEAYRIASAKDYHLPARESLAQHGVTFTHHYTAAAMCSPSRASFLTGVPPQVHGVFDQEEYSYVPTLDPNRPNMGSVLKSLGYRTAYFGKFEMDKKLLATSDTTNYSTLIRPYGFDSFNYDGDVGGQPLQGYTHDPYYVGEAVRWLHKNANDGNAKPFFLVISLLNPHDIMYGDANIPNTVQAQHAVVNNIFPPPANSLYQTKWQFTLPVSLNESLMKPGMPNALNQYNQGWSGALGIIPPERKDMWQLYYNYYLNALRDNDRNLQIVINTLNQMNLWKNTIVILTADHGEMGGSHGGLRGKGPMAYEENTHIPLIIAHPDSPHGTICNALTSHLDLLPTLIGFSNLPTNNITNKLPGHDFSNLLSHPQDADLHAVRKGILFNYVGISTTSEKYLLATLIASFSQKPLPPIKEADQSKRGFLSFVFEGRYKFARYYAPNRVNTPTTLEEILKDNDVQLFDLQNDPNELTNLALQPEKNKALILQMNALLNELIANEVGTLNVNFLKQQ